MATSIAIIHTSTGSRVFRLATSAHRTHPQSVTPTATLCTPLPHTATHFQTILFLTHPFPHSRTSTPPVLSFWHVTPSKCHNNFIPYSLIVVANHYGRLKGPFCCRRMSCATLTPNASYCSREGNGQFSLSPKRSPLPFLGHIVPPCENPSAVSAEYSSEEPILLRHSHLFIFSTRWSRFFVNWYNVNALLLFCDRYL